VQKQKKITFKPLEIASKADFFDDNKPFKKQVKPSLQKQIVFFVACDKNQQRLFQVLNSRWVLSLKIKKRCIPSLALPLRLCTECIF
jgi:hypothetical protein